MNNMKPIIFSGPMVKAILEGRKTQTRRIIKPQPIDNTEVDGNFFEGNHKGYVKVDGHKNWQRQFAFEFCHYGKVGDILYVRETWVRACLSEDGEGPVEGEKWKYWYRADDEWTKHDWHNPNVDGPVAEPRWKPSIHMPRKAARIFLKITDIRVERLQEIQPDDATAEGIEFVTEDLTPHVDGPVRFYKDYSPGCDTFEHANPVESFETLWRKINGDESWNENPFVWVISFEKIDKPTNV